MPALTLVPEPASRTVPLNELDPAASPELVVSVYVDEDPDMPGRRRLHIDNRTLWEGRRRRFHPARFSMLSGPSCGPSPAYLALLRKETSAEEYVASVRRDVALEASVHRLLRSGDVDALCARFAA